MLLVCIMGYVDVIEWKGGGFLRREEGGKTVDGGQLTHGTGLHTDFAGEKR